MGKLTEAAKGNRYGHRDATMILVAYRHGLRVSELVDLRWDQVDFTLPVSALRDLGAQRYEAKLDGYRLQLHRHEGAARAFTRNALDWSAELAPICLALAALPARSMVLDGELVAPGENGAPDFGAVRGAISREPEQARLLRFRSALSRRLRPARCAA